MHKSTDTFFLGLVTVAQHVVYFRVHGFHLVHVNFLFLTRRDCHFVFQVRGVLCFTLLLPLAFYAVLDQESQVDPDFKNAGLPVG